MLVLDCDNPGNGAPSTIEESFAAVVTIAGAVPAPAGCVIGTFPLLYGMIVCLAERVASISGDALVDVSGDNQTAAAATALPNQLLEALLDAGGNPVTGGSAPVFTIAAGEAAWARSRLSPAVIFKPHGHWVRRALRP